MVLTYIVVLTNFGCQSLSCMSMLPVLLLLLVPGIDTTPSASRPHIVVLMADDLGWNEVGWNNPVMRTPTLDRLAREGVVLNQSYMHPTCSPSRAAFLSGMYAHRLGLQHDTIVGGRAQFLPDNVTLLPQSLKKLGYATHAIGKWHLGFCNWRYTPTYRGFDSFYGYYNAKEDYFTHMAHLDGYDFRDNTQVDWTARGHYSTWLLAERAIRIIRDHEPSQPLFMYLAFQAVHGELQAPAHYVNHFCSHVQGNKDRKVKCGMLAALDEAVANVTAALTRAGLMDNTLLLFTTDNGGTKDVPSSNWPLRGFKGANWEGGTRAVGFLHAPKLLARSGYTSDNLIHVSDWFPTFLEAAEGEERQFSDIDGVSQWQALQMGKEGPRYEMLYEIDDVYDTSAIRQGPYKLVQGAREKRDGHFAPPEIKKEKNFKRDVDLQDYMLFNVINDPQENYDISQDHLDLVSHLKARLEYHWKFLVPSRGLRLEPSAHPMFNNGTWSPGWC